MAEQQETGTRTRNTTEYVVLEAQGEDGRWVERELAIDAKSRRDAIAQTVARMENASGTFVAVPRREWKPMSRKVETKQVETWE